MVPLFSLSLYLCCLQTRLLSMDAAPFRQFLSSKVYASKEDLSEAVGRDKGADEFCTWVLDLRFEWRSRRSVGEYIQQRDSRVCRTNGSVLLSKRFLIYGLFYTRGVVHVPRGL